MITSYVQRWLQMIQGVSRELGWDPSLILSMTTDDRTFIVQVRKSAVVFTIVQESAYSDRFATSYMAYPPGSPPDTTLRRFASGQFRSAADVDRELELWLRESVARHAAETKLPD